MTKRILDEETRKALLGYVPFSSECSINYSPEEFMQIKDESLRPVFKVRSLTQAEMMQIKRNSSGYRGATPEQIEKIGEGNIAIIRGCILGWHNIFDSGSGTEIEFIPSTNGGCEEKLFRAFPDWVIVKIMNFVRTISGLSSPEELSIK
jgi:hypothetical protein